MTSWKNKGYYCKGKGFLKQLGIQLVQISAIQL